MKGSKLQKNTIYYDKTSKFKRMLFTMTKHNSPIVISSMLITPKLTFVSADTNLLSHSVPNSVRPWLEEAPCGLLLAVTVSQASESVVQSLSTRSQKPSGVVTVPNEWVSDRYVLSKLCARPEGSPESNSVYNLQKSF